jgi:hypothetical protein
MAPHDLAHFGPIRRTAARRPQHVGNFPEIERADRGRRNHTQRLRVGFPEVVETVDGASPNAESLAGPDLN